MQDYSLLRTLCSIHAPSGNEEAMTTFLLEYIATQKASWKFQPQVFSGDGFQNCIVLAFGKPRTAVYAHIDNIGYTVRYDHELVPIGSPHARNGTPLRDGNNNECQLLVDGDDLGYRSRTAIARGTSLSFQPNWREDAAAVQCCYMDNRMGVWTALQLCETLEHGAIVFSSWEEHGGGSIAFLAKFLHDRYGILQSLICDITWVTEGVTAGNGTGEKHGINSRRFHQVVSARAIGCDRLQHAFGQARRGISFRHAHGAKRR